MTATSTKAAASAAFPADDYALPERITAGHASRGPRVGDEVWDLHEFLPRTQRERRVIFTDFTPGLQRQTAQEYLYWRMRLRINGQRKPMKPTWLPQEVRSLFRTMEALAKVGAPRLQDVQRHHLEAFLKRSRPSGPSAVHIMVNTLKSLSAVGEHLSADRLSLVPWPYRSAQQIAGLTPRRENGTPRIPEEIMGPFLAGAVFYLEKAGPDILAAAREIKRLEAQIAAGPKEGRGGSEAKIQDFIARRRAAGRGIPALPIQLNKGRPGAPVVDGIVQWPNMQLIGLLAGVRSTNRYTEMVVEVGRSIGFEVGGVPTSRAPWPASGRPWRPEMSRHTLGLEMGFLRTACWIIIAYLSGMRDVEVRELSRDCAVVETATDGRLRYKIHGRVYKDRRLSGDEEEWVVLEIVHRAVDMLLEINDDSTHLFGFTARDGDLGLMRAIPQRLNSFRDHLNELFSTDQGPYIPLPATDAVPGTEDLDEDTDQASEARDAADATPMPWAFDTRQFRRTLAWHIAFQPFGMVAGTRQYKHASFAVFEGYAGTSASGFADEVAADKAVAMLDYVEDLYHDWNDGGRSSGGAANRIEAEFDRIRAELGDLPGTVASPERVRTMLRHLTHTLHPGVLNDCFHHAETAVCEKRSPGLGRPLPMLNMCLTCPNSRRSSVHLPRLHQTREQALQEFGDTTGLPPHQATAIGEFVNTLDTLINELAETGAAR
ncbi:hypothetical protein [Streptomyces hokutonensis]|uniref:hypothetical protein n=1 Tax=Streptomyces hokutonensis TaxID=1306990 RepID=UPI00368F8919